ncbi:hypothetical protein [Streptomyces cinereoruber]|uniref:hypothetical protein n=1 Tax=Streptomyces cinereoruber TaxID=67260 RepID=UPI003637C9E6
MPHYPRRLPARARRARTQLLGLISGRRPRADYGPEGLLRVVEAAALDAAAKRLLRDPTGAPLDLSEEAAAGWRAGRAAAVLDLIAEAERIAPPPPPLPPSPAPLFCRSLTAPVQEDDGPWRPWGMPDWGRADPADTTRG